MVRRFPTKRFAAGSLLLVAWLLFKVTVVSWSVTDLENHSGEVSSTHSTLTSLERLLNGVRRLESGQRGYLLTGDAAYLETFDPDAQKTQQRLDQLDRQVLQDPGQTRQMVAVRRLVDRKVAELSQTVALHRDGRADEALAVVRTGAGKRYMTELRERIDVMEAAELQDLGQRAAAVQRAYRVAMVLEVAGSLVTLGLAALLLSMLRGHLRREQKSDEALDEQRHLLATTLESIGDGVVICDPAGDVTFINPVGESLLGCSCHDCDKQALAELMHLELDTTGERVGDPLRWTLAASGRGDDGHTLTLIGADGSRRAVDFFAAPIRDGEAETGGTVLVFRDVTERREAQAKLRRSEERFRGISNTIPVIAWIADEEGRVQWFNDEFYRFTGAPRGENDGYEWMGHMAEEEAERFLANYLHAVRTGNTLKDTMQVRRHDGVTRSFLVQAERVRDEASGKALWYGANTDITEQAEMQAKLQAGDAAKDEFLAMLGHELRNPLAAITYGVKLLNKMDGQDKTATIREIVATQTRHMSRLVDDLLDVSRIMRGKVSVKREPMDLRDAVNDALGTVAPEIDAGGFDVQLELGDEPTWITGDRERLTQVATNLLNNALRYSEDEKALQVILTQSDDAAVLAISDHGIGIGARRDRGHLRTVPPGPAVAGPNRRRAGRRAYGRQADRGDARREHRGIQCRARPGQHLYRPPPPAPGGPCCGSCSLRTSRTWPR